MEGTLFLKWWNVLRVEGSYFVLIYCISHFILFVRRALCRGPSAMQYNASFFYSVYTTLCLTRAKILNWCLGEPLFIWLAILTRVHLFEFFIKRASREGELLRGEIMNERWKVERSLCRVSNSTISIRTDKVVSYCYCYFCFILNIEFHQ